MRRLAFALPLIVCLASLASAQTVIVTHAPAGAPVDVVFDNDRVANAVADSNGQATLTFALPPQLTEADVHVATERCGDTRRVLLVERGIQGAPPTTPCDRRDFPDVFVVQRITTFVVDFTNPTPSVHLRQGPAPAAWLGDEGASTSRLNLPPAPKGLLVSGGVGFAAAGNWTDTVCGTNTTSCTATGTARALSASAAYWLTPNIGVEAGYLRPSDASASGSGTDFTFTSTRKTEVALISGLVGGAIGGFRIYGRGGATYHRATLSTSETVQSVGSQNLESKTAGWSWHAGGGFEMWLKPYVALYVDGGVVQLRGNGVGGADAVMDEQLIVANVGVRLHLWR
ncbi:MAG TPA: outer membrane beta-barrel protein [Vicinamibacterales bacterium]|nr:outer membrane beta-barrel protein [Vicinamibacterales bacterium]